MSRKGWRRGAAREQQYGTIDLAVARWGTLRWQHAIDMGAGVTRVPVVAASDHSEIGPGWALLAVRLARRLRCLGAPAEQWPALITIGAGELHFTVPRRASRRVQRVVAAMSRLALRQCEVCLRGPVSTYTLYARGQQETLRLCAWHRARLAEVGWSGTFRVEAWDAVRHGAGPLRAMLLGGRLSPVGVEAALAQFAESTPPGRGEVGWIPVSLMLHALSRLEPQALAGVSVDALLPLLSDGDEEVRRAAMLVLPSVQYGAALAPQRPTPASTAASAVAPPTAAVAVPAAHLHLAEAPDVTAPALPRPAYPIRPWCVETASGSTYVLVHDARDVWWLGGRNVTTWSSVSIPPGRLYEIEVPVPWPPQLGHGLALVASSRLSAADPARLPGGGKYTSAVVAVSAMTTEPEHELPSATNDTPVGHTSETSTGAPPADERLADSVEAASVRDAAIGG